MSRIPYTKVKARGSSSSCGRNTATPSTSGATPRQPSTAHTGLSIAPAGHKYKSIEHAGEGILNQNCNGFPNTISSSIIPPLFHKQYPEKYDETTSQIAQNSRTLTKEEQNKFFGVRSNQGGENAEYDVFRAFEELISEQQQEPLLILRNFCMDTDNRKNVKRLELYTELASINLTHVRTNDERDFLVLVRDLGIVLLEVKTSTAMIATAEQQLDNGRKFVCALMDAITGASSLVLPCVKVVIVPNELSPSPVLKTTQGSHVVYNDKLNNFKSKWNEILNDLRRLKLRNLFHPRDFTRLTRFMVGLWSMKVMYRSSRKFNFYDTEASVPHQTKEVDNMVDHGHLSSDVTKEKDEHKKELPVTDDVVYCKKGAVVRQTSDINLVYLTPRQKNMYDNFLRGIIRGPAGTGKSFLILFKIIEIMLTNPNERVLLLAPHPHHIRCHNILMSNNVNVSVSKTFPPTTFMRNAKKMFGYPEKGEVVVMDLHLFFGVTRNELLSYDVSRYHLFTDDFQSHTCGTSGHATFDDIFEFIEKTYITSRDNDKYFWCAVDLVQALSFGNKSRSYDPSLLLYERRDGKPRPISTPVFILQEILRNTTEIATCSMDARDFKASSNTAQIVANAHAGHSICGAAVVCHQLAYGTGFKYQEQFVLERVVEELRVVFAPPHALKHSDVAILCDRINYTEAIEQTLRSRNIKHQTIEQQLLANKKTRDLVVDKVENVLSFETMCVICVEDNYGGGESATLYNLLSRARTRLILIQPRVRSNSFTPQHCNIVTWGVKYGCITRL